MSVVMPAFNAADHIGAALASIDAQILQPDEVVFVDDASSDETTELVRRWSVDRRVVVATNDVNIGCGASRNKGVEIATGDLIAPLDADDVWLPDHLSTLVPLAADPLTIVAAMACRWRPGSGMEQASKKRSSLPPPDRQVEAILRFNFLFTGCIHWRKAAVASGGSLARRANDWETWIRMIVETDCRVVPAPHATILYRTGDDTLSASDGGLPDEIDLCLRLMENPAYEAHRDLLVATMRRRQARVAFLEGVAEAKRGDIRTARRSYVRALRTDPSWRGWASQGAQGSVALRSLFGLVSPRAFDRARNRRLADKVLVDADQPPVTIDANRGNA